MLKTLMDCLLAGAVPRDSRVDSGRKDFLLAEYRALLDLRESNVRIGEQRMTSFLTALSAVLVTIGLLTRDANLPAPAVVNVIVIVLVGLALLGSSVFVRLIGRSIAVVEYTRAANRIRRYFVTMYPDLDAYVRLPITDDTPAYTASRRSLGLVTMCALLNAAILAFAAALYASVELRFIREAVIAVGVGALIISLVGHHLVYRRAMGIGAKRYFVRFAATDKWWER